MRLRMLTAALLLTSLAGAQERQLPLHVLAFTHCAGFVHSSIDESVTAMKQIGAASGLFDVVESNDCAAISADNLAKYDVVYLYTSGNWPLSDEQKTAFTDWVEHGGGVVGIHSATDSNYNWPWYGEMIGGYFDGHPWTQPVRIKVERHDHPCTEELPDELEVRDEIYQQRDWSRDKLQVLMSLDPTSVDLTREAVHRQDHDFGILWGREIGKGRAMYSALGHFEDVWDRADVRTILLGAIKWVTRTDWRSDAKVQALLEAKDLAGLAGLVTSRPMALRGEAVKALGSVDSNEAAAELAKLAAAPQPEDVRVSALRTLGRMTTGGLDPIVGQLADGSEAVRAAAVEALGNRGTAAAEEQLRGLLGAAQAGTKVLAATALLKFSTPSAQKALLGLLTGTDAALQEVALRAFATADEPTVRQAMLELLQARDEAHRTILPGLVLRLATAAGTDDVFKALLGAVQQGDAALRAAALRALAGTGRAEVADILLPRLFDPDGGVAAAAQDAIRQAGNIDLTDHLTPYIQQWQVIGPFDNPQGHQGHDQVYPPETEQSFGAEYEGVGGKVKWAAVAAKGDLVDFRTLGWQQQDFACSYAYAVVRSPSELDCELRLGSDDGCKVWLNGDKVLDRNVDRGLGWDADRVNVHLRQGDNALLVKVLQSQGDWRLAVRFGRREGGMKGVGFGLPAGP